MLSNIFYYANRKSPTILKEITLTPLNPTEVLVKTTHAGLNPVDVKLKGIAYFSGSPTIMDFSGTIAEVGSSVTQFKPGDSVFGFVKGVGTLIKIDVAKTPIAHQPRSIKPDEAAVLPVVFATAVKLIESGAPIDTESSILVLGGATSVGAALIQLLKKHHNVKHVVASCSSESVSTVKQYGADATIDYRSTTFTQQLEELGPFTNIYDCVGGPEVVAIAGKLLTITGWYVTVSGDKAPSIRYSEAIGLSALAWLPRAIVRKLFGSWWNVRWTFTMATDSSFANNASIIETANIRVPIYREFEAAEVQKAFDMLDSVKPPRGKLVLKF